MKAPFAPVRYEIGKLEDQLDHALSTAESLTVERDQIAERIRAADDDIAALRRNPARRQDLAKACAHRLTLKLVDLPAAENKATFATRVCQEINHELRRASAFDERDRIVERAKSIFDAFVPRFNQLGETVVMMMATYHELAEVVEKATRRTRGPRPRFHGALLQSRFTETLRIHRVPSDGDEQRPFWNGISDFTDIDEIASERVLSLESVTQHERIDEPDDLDRFNKGVKEMENRLCELYLDTANAIVTHLRQEWEMRYEIAEANKRFSEFGIEPLDIFALSGRSPPADRFAVAVTLPTINARKLIWDARECPAPPSGS